MLHFASFIITTDTLPPFLLIRFLSDKNSPHSERSQITSSQNMVGRCNDSVLILLYGSRDEFVVM